MKKLFTIALAALLFAVSANAQSYFNIGYGFCMDKQSISGVTDESNSNAFTAGLSYNFKIVKNLGVEPGVNYFFNFSKVGEELGYRNYHHGVQVPVLVNYKFTPARDIAFKLMAGPSVNYGLSDKSTTFVGDEKGYTIDNYDGDFSRLGIAASFGVAAEWNDSVRFKIGYELGLNDLQKADYFEFKQDILTFSIGFIF